jgi:hypothetical protein
MQCRGVPKPVDPPIDPLALLRAVVLRLADMHACLWRSPELVRPSGSWLKASSWYRWVPPRRRLEAPRWPCAWEWAWARVLVCVTVRVCVLACGRVREIKLFVRVRTAVKTGTRGRWARVAAHGCGRV